MYIERLATCPVCAQPAEDRGNDTFLCASRKHQFTADEVNQRLNTVLAEAVRNDGRHPLGTEPVGLAGVVAWLKRKGHLDGHGRITHSGRLLAAGRGVVTE